MKEILSSYTKLTATKVVKAILSNPELKTTLTGKTGDEIRDYLKVTKSPWGKIRLVDWGFVAEWLNEVEASKGVCFVCHQAGAEFTKLYGVLLHPNCASRLGISKDELHQKGE